MFRLTCVAEDEVSATLTLDGWVTGPWVAEILQECERYLARRHTVRLDLSGVRFADPQGLALLTAVHRRGVHLSGASSFLLWRGLTQPAEVLG